MCAEEGQSLLVNQNSNETTVNGLYEEKLPDDHDRSSKITQMYCSEHICEPGSGSASGLIDRWAYGQVITCYNTHKV